MSLMKQALVAGVVICGMLSPAIPAAASAGHGPPGSPKSDAEDGALAFDPAAYTELTVTVDGQPMAVRWYREICYVADPILMAKTQNGREIANPECGYQSMNVFVPESSAENPRTAIYFAVNNSGWMASYIRASVTDGAAYDSTASNVGAALKAGYVFVDVASRSRGIVAADGTYPGKSPAAVVDAKAAVRYLRLNDSAMPGSAERIVVNGTSGGGALTAALAASGNSRDYDTYLADVGAAGISSKRRSTIRDDVFAANAYCPITDLGNADIAYEWLFTTLGTRATTRQDPAPATSAAIAADYPAYLKSLGLRDAAGRKLTADTMLKMIRDEVARSAETFMKAAPTNVVPDLGETVPSVGLVNDWIDVDNDRDKVVSIDMTKYLAFVVKQRALKPAPAFDQVGVNGLTGGETNLFGTDEQVYSNFTAYAWNNNSIAGDGTGVDDTGLTWARFLRQRGTVVDEQVDLIDPMHYIGTNADTAPYWYVRHGTRDRDTAFTVSINLDSALESDRSVKEVDYQLAWDKPHAGNYDVPEAMAWIAGALREAGPVKAPTTHGH
ncbi:alpha/beta hydrolase fold domain-containing protein [Mumia sp. ZJ1417]|uniref:subtype B tannase n=1 Tax=Mumia sp. ZJ1417 TaxID=2708082 RepID=UPI00141F59CF|nr:subtype B tannase [Mumia sp. ZJ1417]QMW66730.1 alpha/beta hydrolase fold domain-containing protein [Mumia sp. ZJ1417]